MARMIPMFLKEMEQEANTTRKMLSRIPDDKYDWKPHPRSMTIRSLATHIAELPGWVTMTLNTDELDFSKSAYQPTVINNTKELLQLFEKSLAEGKKSLQQSNEEELEKPWTMRNGEKIYNTSPKSEVLRMSYCQTVHHRAQLGVYLRLLDIPIPGSYGPSADENNF
ncbi:MAG: DinB family protein [Flavisolibacter sp.]